MSSIKPIRSEQDHAAALARIELLMDAEPGTPAADELDVLADLCARSPLPVNVMAGPGAPSVDELAAVGVRRVTVGTAVAQAAYTLVRRATAELLSGGTYDALAGSSDFGAIDSLFAPPVR